MATVHLTREQYEALEDREPPTPLSRRIPFWGLVLGALVWVGLIGQYFFVGLAVLLGALLGVIFFILEPRARLAHERSLFYFGPFDIELREDGFTLREGANVLRLAQAEIEWVHESPRFYELAHHCGVQFRLPKAALSSEEMGCIEGYRRQHPDHPAHCER